MRTLVRISNFVAAASIILLIYWVFVFILVEVFGLRVFRENLSQTFGLSVMGILAAMAGSLMINVMLNMTRIADRQEGLEISETKKTNRFSILSIALIAVFPLLTIFLFGGDYLTSRKKEALLVSSAKSVIEKYPAQVNTIADYGFTEEWLLSTSESVELMERTDENFPAVAVLVRDNQKGSDIVLSIRRVSVRKPDEEPRSKQDFLFTGSKDEREYLKSVFEGGNTVYRFSASDGNYELFYPYFKDGRKVVFYFTDFQQYGKLGS